ncbi:MAG: thioesterase family protein [Gemmatimonadota bacterium]|nr:thioesterase family protein [Gemmatimonadota bacterium]
MNLIFRMIRVLLAARARPRVQPLEETTLSFRVWPSDVDVLIHMNNGRYLTLMDLGRADSIIRSGVQARVRENGWYSVVAAETIRFRESLGLFAKFELRTRLVGWDDKSFYLRQLFLLRGRITAVGVVRVRFLNQSGGALSAAEVASVILPGVESPELPDYISDWGRAEAGFSRATSIQVTQNHRTALGV